MNPHESDAHVRLLSERNELLLGDWLENWATGGAPKSGGSAPSCSLCQICVLRNFARFRVRFCSLFVNLKRKFFVKNLEFLFVNY